jgi:CRP-like cAMP-binding protein
VLRNKLPDEHADNHHPVAWVIDQDFGIELIAVEFDQMRLCFCICRYPSRWVSGVLSWKLCFVGALCYDSSRTEASMKHTGKITALRQTRLFGSLDEEALLWLATRAEEQRLTSGEMLFLSGEAATGMFVVVSGTIRAFQQNSEGREQVMHIDAAGATLGDVPVFDDGPYPASAVAQMDSDVLFISKHVIHQFCLQHPHFVLVALKMMAERVRKHAQLVNSLSFQEVGQRLALLLLAEAERVGTTQDGQIVFHLNLSNHEIATRIGSVRDVVSRDLARLQKLGLVAVKMREVTIRNARALRVYAEPH